MVSGADTGYHACSLHTPPAKRGGQTTQATPLARPIDTPLPSPHKRNQLSPPQGASKESLTCSHSPCCSKGPSKAWISFLASDQFLFSSVTQSCSTLCNPHGLQHTRLPHPSPTPRVCSNSRPLSQWCHPTVSSSVVPFSSCLQSFPASGSFPLSQFFTSGAQSIGASPSASVLPMNIQD